ncbi:MAG: dethiobiotin synthase [Fibromonadaceae bacterium]|jgi:dethiobiotin synthetase|nr:dethiobiotin synthase [Fibromonadaceae bacterium]
MVKGFFIAGTGTGVGKSCVSVFLLSFLKLAKGKILYYKPIQCGQPSDGAFVKKAAKHKDVASTYNLKTAASPHFAFRKEKKKFSSQAIKSFLSKAKNKYDLILMEGAGGLRVPITKNFDMADLAKLSGFPVILVASPELGTINHTLLSIDYLKTKKLEIEGFMFYLSKGEDSKNEIIEDNAKTIEDISKVKFLGAVPKHSTKFHLSLKKLI